MAIHVALNHKTHYLYDRRVNLGPQIVRLRPAPHTRNPILSYSLKINPKSHYGAVVTKDGTITPVGPSSIEGFQSRCPASPSMRARRV